MTKAKSGPNFSPVPLVKQLESAVAYATEARRQGMCVPASQLPSEYALLVTHNELDRVICRG